VSVIYDFDVTSGILRLCKQDPAIRWIDRNKYAIDRLDSIASDGETVPITIV
jgi:protease II